MLSNPKLRTELNALFKAREWKAISIWFRYWDNNEEMIDKAILFGHFFMPHYFRDKSPLFHRYLVEAFFSDFNQYMAAPRGFSKTTILQTCILFSCCNKMDEFIVLIEKTFSEAAEVLSAVREEAARNELLLKCYGKLLPPKSRGEEKSKDAEGDLFVNGVRLRAKGFDQPIRGLKSREWRPTRIVMDDVEQDSHIRNPEQRKKYEDAYNKGVQPAIDINEGSIKVYGTILHEDSLLMNLIRLHKGKVFRAYYTEVDEEWEEAKGYSHDALDENGRPIRLLWSSRWSYDKLMKKKADMVSSGQSSNAFEQEYRNYPIAEEERKFKYEWLYNPDRKITMSEFMALKVPLVGVAAIDAADSTKEGSDFTAMVVWFLDPDGNRYRVDVRNERRNISGLVDLIFEVWEKWHSKGLIKIGVEKKAFEDQVQPLLELKKKERGIYPRVEELKPMGRSKENRIEGALVGLYEYGKLITVTDDRGQSVGDTALLLEQLYNFPGSAKDDLSDAEAYLKELEVIPMKGDLSHMAPHSDPVDDPFEKQFSQAPYYPDGETIIQGNGHLDQDPY